MTMMVVLFEKLEVVKDYSYSVFTIRNHTHNSMELYMSQPQYDFLLQTANIDLKTVPKTCTKN
jgi:hypothetical protein